MLDAGWLRWLQIVVIAFHEYETLLSCSYIISWCKCVLWCVAYSVSSLMFSGLLWLRTKITLVLCSQSSQKEVTLSDFKFIYYMEWGHRMWGRGVGLAFILPALYFLRKGWISKALKPRLAVYAGLLGFQVWQHFWMALYTNSKLWVAYRLAECRIFKLFKSGN